MNAHVLFRIVFFISLVTGFLQQNLAFGQTSLSGATNAVKKLVENPKLKGAQIGVAVLDMKNGKIIASHQEDKLFLPASTQKLITTAAAAELLKTNFNFKTELIAIGSIREGHLNGNIYLKGYGDPSLGSEVMFAKGKFEEWLDQCVDMLLSKGIKSVQGSVFADESYLPVPPEQATWQWMDLGNYYAGGAWAINAHDNLFYITFQQSTQLGKTPEIIKIEPEVPGLILKNEVTTAGSTTGDNAYVYGAPFQDTRIIRGTIPAGSGLFTIKASLPHPAKFIVHHLKKRMESKGITITGEAVSLENPKVELIHTWSSPTLEKLIEIANKESNNLICESLYHELGKVGKNGDQKYDGKTTISDWFEQKSGEKWPFFLEDGSGLSMKNAVSPRAFVRFLHQMQFSPVFTIWKNTIAIAGKEGTVKTLAKNVSWGRFRLKSGSLGRVRCYAGYLEINNDAYAICLLINQHSLGTSDIRQIIDTFLEQLVVK
jgi:serine-type D-Ala-D-Ala carboxypeptidase/endopeptidase (penicillin-binding protein 4)